MNIQQSYREATVRGASPVELVVRLYEQMIEDLRQAAIAIEQKEIEQRTKRIKHAILVVGHLQPSLDFAKGGKVAQDLDNFYNAVRQSLVWVQFHPSKRGVTQLITDLLAVREAWIVVDRAERPSVTTPAGMVPSAAGASSESDHERVGWKG
jgi:flagellar protein FliS